MLIKSWIMSKKIRRKKIMSGGQVLPAVIFFILLLGLSIFVFLLSTNKISIAYNDGYQPDQPLPFSHKVHVSEHGMDCRFCHTSVEEGKHAGVPSLDICMSCHLTVKADSPHIQKLITAYTNKEPIVWEKVHLLPDFVKFNHALHIKALTGGIGKIPPSGEKVKKACTTCHGRVEDMGIMYQHNSLSMGQCVQCHRENKHKGASDECSKCHY